MSEKFYTNVSRYGNFILARGYDHGRRVHKKVKYQPYLFIPSKEKSEYKTIHGDNVARVDFDSMKEAKEFIERYEDVDNFSVYGFNNFPYTYIYDTYPSGIHVDLTQLNIGTIDIEVAKDENGYADVELADKPITAITLKRRDTIISFSYFDFDAPEGVIYIKCKDEETLLMKFLEAWKHFDLDIVTGWNVSGYDIPYIIRRLSRVLGEDYSNKLSPWNIIEEVQIKKIDKTTANVPAPKGIAILDYLTLYRKFTYTEQEQYTLNYISFVELGEEKIDYSEFNDLQELYEKDFDKFMRYNIKDVLLVDKLEDKLGMIALAVTFAYDAGINFIDVFGTVRPWDVIIHNYLMDKKIVIPQYKSAVKSEQFRGAYVKETQVGSHKWVVSFDVASLYPSLMVQYNMSPETIRKKHDEIWEKIVNNEEIPLFKGCIAGNGLEFDKSTLGFVPEIVKKKLTDRKLYKNKMLDAEKRFEEILKEIEKRNIH